jgi:hypothetical protein
LFAVRGSLVVPYTTPPHLDNSASTLSRVDALGAFTGISGLVLVNFAWNQAPIVSCTTPYTYILLILGFLFLSLFAYIEIHVSKFPLIPFTAMDADVGYL